MPAFLRLRQICLVAPALGPAEADIVAVLGLPVVYRDPNVGAYGLENALFALGPDILEVVAPTRDDTAAGRFLARSGGRGGYMVILDCDDVAARQAHAHAIGVRTTHEIRHPGYHGVQLHPRDCRAAMVEFNHTEGGEALSGPYHPAGADWTRVVRPEAPPRLLAAELEGPDPAGLGAHWARLMQRPLAEEGGAPAIRLDRGVLRFLPAEAERLGGLELGVTDPAAVRAAAAARGLVQPDGGILLVGVRLTLRPFA